MVCCVYSLYNRLDEAMLKNTHNKHIYDKIGKIPKVSLNVCFLELSEQFPKNEFESATENESSVFEPFPANTQRRNNVAATS